MWRFCDIILIKISALLTIMLKFPLFILKFYLLCLHSYYRQLLKTQWHWNFSTCLVIRRIYSRNIGGYIERKLFSCNKISHYISVLRSGSNYFSLCYRNDCVAVYLSENVIRSPVVFYDFSVYGESSVVVYGADNKQLHLGHSVKILHGYYQSAVFRVASYYIDVLFGRAWKIFVESVYRRCFWTYFKRIKRCKISVELYRRKYNPPYFSYRVGRG